MAEDFGGGVKEWFARPENKAALLQFGLTLMQPPQWGQGTGAQIASAIGAGAEAQQRHIGGKAAAAKEQAELAIKQQEANASLIRARNAGGMGGLSATALFNADRKAEEKFGDFLQDALNSEAFTAEDQSALLADNAWLAQKEEEFGKLYPSLVRRKAPKTATVTGQAEALAKAKDAITKGAPREKVIQRLKDAGYSAEGL